MQRDTKNQKIIACLFVNGRGKGGHVNMVTTLLSFEYIIVLFYYSSSMLMKIQISTLYAMKESRITPKSWGPTLYQHPKKETVLSGRNTDLKGNSQKNNHLFSVSFDSKVAKMFWKELLNTKYYVALQMLKLVSPTSLIKIKSPRHAYRDVFSYSHSVTLWE